MGGRRTKSQIHSLQLCLDAAGGGRDLGRLAPKTRVPTETVVIEAPMRLETVVVL